MSQESNLLIQKLQVHNNFDEDIEWSGHFPACQMGGKTAKIDLAARTVVGQGLSGVVALEKSAFTNSRIPVTRC